MPGMMDTVLNLGLNDDTVEGLGEATDDPRFAYDTYRRLINMFGDMVMGVDHHHFEEIIEHTKQDTGVTEDTELTAQDWHRVAASYKDMIEAHIGKPFPQDPEEQLWGAIDAVFKSWMNPRAINYRELNDIPAVWGTAVNVQSMVFGNMGDDCATGVCFTRDPSTGENKFYGEFLVNAQGEDVVAGIRTPQPLSRRAKPTRPWKWRCRGLRASCWQITRDAREALPGRAGHRVHDRAAASCTCCRPATASAPAAAAVQIAWTW